MDRADRVADHHRSRRRANFKKLFNPGSIVFIGGRGNAFAIEYCRDFGFEGEMWSVNPKHRQIGGINCVATLADLPSLPDAAWIAISSRAAIDTVRELAAMGVPSGICYTAGFSESGNNHLEEELAAAGDMALLGPNCMGLINFLDGVGMVAGTHGLQRFEHGIACIAQSGTIVANMVTSDRSLPISHLISMGNQSVLDLADGIDAVTDDPRVDAIMLYVEGLKDARAFAHAVKRAHQADKPIVCLKGGVSQAGQAIALSHTGSLAGAPELYQAFFERLGIITVDSFSGLLEMSKLLALGGLPNGNRLLVETASGTASGYCADMAERYGVVLPQPDVEVKAELAAVLPPIATPMNPMDVTMMQWGDREAQARSLITLLKCPADAAALVINLPTGVDSPTYGPALEAMCDVRQHTSLPCYVITNLPEGASASVREKLIASDVIPLQEMEDAFACIGRAARYMKQRERIHSAGGPDVRLYGTGTLAPGRLLDETASKRALAAHGVTVPSSRVVGSPEEACAAAQALGFPVVLKGHGSPLSHKTELGAVAVNLGNEQAVLDAAANISQIAEVEELLVESMVTDTVAEVIVGIKRDPSLGLALIIGSGGVFTELVGDTVPLILPANEDEIRAAIESLRVATLLRGFRTRPPGDLDAPVATVMGIAAYAVSNADVLLELDVNPVLVRPAGAGAVAVDALIHLGVSRNE